MPKRVIVLGVLRSGTSLTADLVRRWGAYAGQENELWKSDINDPRGYGYMEYVPLQQLNDELLDNNDRVPLPNDLLAKKAAEQTYQDKALQLVRSMDNRTSEEKAIAWIWKDARLPLTLPFWTKFWEDAIYIVTVRHPAETALSAAKTELLDQENLPFSAAFAYWQFCMLNILSFTQNSPHKLFIAYDRLVDDPVGECTRLCRFLDEQCDLPSESTQARVETMLSRVSGGQRHYHYGKSLAEMYQSTKEQRALYDFLRVKTIYPNEAFNEADFALYPGWQEYLQCMDMLMGSGQMGEM